MKNGQNTEKYESRIQGCEGSHHQTVHEVINLPLHLQLHVQVHVHLHVKDVITTVKSGTKKTWTREAQEIRIEARKAIEKSQKDQELP